MAPHRIMVVDDDPDVRFVVSSLLGMDFETTEATNGLDALEKIDRYEPDLLLMDISMPVMNGIACCHAIQRSPQFEKIPVIFLSASSDPAVRAQAFSAGGAGFFEKPFNTADLIQSIQAQFFGAEVAPKRFSIADVSRIDAMPLRAVEPEENQSESDDVGRNQTLMIDPPEVEGRQRRVFGRKPAQPEAPPPPPPPPQPPPPPPQAVGATPPASNSGLLPQAPQPNYARAGEEFRRRQAEKEKAPPPPSPPPPPPPPAAPAPKAVAPPPPAAPVAKQPPVRPPAPPVADKPAELSPAEVLAKRRLAGIGRVPVKATVKPRVLVLIDAPDHLKVFNEALRGGAEFLPLEDPVEALVLIARFQPDIVVMGLHEERYSGLQIAQMMRTNPRLSHMEVVFIQSPRAESSHLNAARTYSRNAILRRPLVDSSVREVIEEIRRRPGFQVREKNLSYGSYVKEVLKTAEEERAKENKVREKQSVGAHYQSLAAFMATELKDYKEPAGYDELKGIGNKIHHIRD